MEAGQQICMECGLHSPDGANTKIIARNITAFFKVGGIGHEWTVAHK